MWSCRYRLRFGVPIIIEKVDQIFGEQLLPVWASPDQVVLMSTADRCPKLLRGQLRWGCHALPLLGDIITGELGSPVF